MLVYEDNFGFSSVSEPEEREFFDFVRRQSILTACERCERPARLIPPKALCASCVSALEYGAPASMKEYGGEETLLGISPYEPPLGNMLRQN
jgi:predicted amidophosphoribosyltransferase